MARQAKGKRETTAAVHSYSHLIRKNGVRPYIKRPLDLRSVSSWSIPDLCTAYGWPSKSAPGGGVIAIIELGGGWTKEDVAQFFKNANLPAPNITDVSVDGTQNSQCNPRNDADDEVALDIQVAGASYAVATDKPANIRVYWSQDIAKAVAAATADGCDVCSISWGADEASWGPAAGDAMELMAAAATAAGMVVFAASGDNDSSDGGPGRANVDLPASAPHVIGCGGTKKPHTDNATDETVWNNDPRKTTGEGTGGGYSKLFPMPSWQAGAPHGPGRMVPDVAANADPNTGYEIILYGASTVVGGTSAVAPLYAGLFASFGAKLGFVTPTLYLNSACFHDITQGDNGAFRGRSGTDPCTGLGTPIGEILKERIQPAAIHASRMRDLMAENAQLRATIASFQASAGALVASRTERPPALLPREIAAPARAVQLAGSVAGGTAMPAPSAIREGVLLALNYPLQTPLPATTPDSAAISSLRQGIDPIWDLAQICTVTKPFSDGGLVVDYASVENMGTTLGGFVSYIQFCYRHPRS
jgi:kumamolisin